MATKKTSKKESKKKKDNADNMAGLLPVSELRGVLGQEMSPSAKILKLGFILSGGINVNPYQVGYHLKMHPAEVHAGLTELKHRKEIVPGADRDTVDVKRESHFGLTK